MSKARFISQVKDYFMSRVTRPFPFVEGELDPSLFNYRLEHTRVVVSLSVDLARELGADELVSVTAAWLHDVAKCPHPDLDPEETRRRASDHGKYGALEADEFLRSIGFPDDKRKQVVDAISQHVGLVKDYVIEDLPAAILWDADKLSKVGVSVLFHGLGYQIVKPWRQTPPGDFMRSFVSYHDEFLDTYRKIVDSFNTKPAQKWGRQRLEQLEDVIRSLQWDMRNV